MGQEQTSPTPAGEVRVGQKPIYHQAPSTELSTLVEHSHSATRNPHPDRPYAAASHLFSLTQPASVARSEMGQQRKYPLGNEGHDRGLLV